MPTLNIPESMKNMNPDEVEIPKAPAQNNLFGDDSEEKRKQRKKRSRKLI